MKCFLLFTYVSFFNGEIIISYFVVKIKIGSYITKKFGDYENYMSYWS